MQALTQHPIVHSYDVATHRVRCGEPRPDRSTKHASGVSCATCRGLLPRRPIARVDAARDATLD